MKIKMKAGCGITNFKGGMRDKNTSAEAGFSHFDRRDARRKTENRSRG